MTALSANQPRVILGGEDRHQSLKQLKASTTVYEGSAVCAEADGLARPVAASLTAPEFMGFAVAYASNVSPDTDTHVLLQQKGTIVVPVGDVTGVSGVGDYGVSIYMADDGDGFTTTSTNNVLIGKLAAVDSDSQAHIAFEADALRSL